jgi:hypothetical protein
MLSVPCYAANLALKVDLATQHPLSKNQSKAAHGVGVRFKATDHISFANNDIVSVSNTSYTDGSVTLQYSSGGQTEKVNLVGLSATQDAAINGILDLNTVFGAGTVF